MKTLLFTLALLCAGTIVHGQPVKSPEVVGPNNTFHDRVFNVSLTFPAGWEMMGGQRWGRDNDENTFGFRPLWPSEARPSLYYQHFWSGNPRPANPEEYFRRTAKTKEESRIAAIKDYRNQTDTYSFRTIAGRPGFSYVATFTMNGQPMSEYFVRLFGETVSLMFFTQGRTEDVDALKAEIDRMAETVKLP
jgi:hypothetical protein